jgi:hypothetical protein
MPATTIALLVNIALGIGRISTTGIAMWRLETVGSFTNCHWDTMCSSHPKSLSAQRRAPGSWNPAQNIRWHRHNHATVLAFLTRRVQFALSAKLKSEQTFRVCYSHSLACEFQHEKSHPRRNSDDTMIYYLNVANITVSECIIAATEFRRTGDRQ